ncbi:MULTISPECIES: beta-galactosidase [Actinomycetes]|uniref:beta-galactosidase n=1 Tax=Actinomycetes TaxID=1760 RepID=UPI0031E474EA
MSRDGEPWFPVTGEVHFSRIAPEHWSDVLGLARSGGLTSVASYVFWRHHEPRPGEFDWSGARDLRRFVRLAAAHGLDVVVRLGPWSHGEMRHGGFPDWLVDAGIPLRQDHPEYLRLVRRLYGQIIAQLEGLTHDDGGPVIAAQIENELADQPEHLATLRGIAEEHGLRVPLWTATGWGRTLLPRRDQGLPLLPVCSGYADGFWADSSVDQPPFAAAHFHYEEVRDDLDDGQPGEIQPGEAPPGAVLASAADAPFITCELGGGMHVAYHRRPLVTPEDVAALALATVGSGSVWQGYYMYAGGSTPDGDQESQEAGQPQDVPRISYDFGAPLGEHATVRAHHGMLRRQHLWLAAEGSRLAPMRSTVGGGAADDPRSLRWAVRTDGESGWLFLSTYRPHGHLDPQTQLQLHLGAREGLRRPQTVPARPLDLPAGVSTVWPLNLALGGPDGPVLRCATAEVLTRRRIAGGSTELLVLTARAGVAVQMLLAGEPEITGPGRRSVTSAGDTLLEFSVAPGPDDLVSCGDVRIMVLDETDADRLGVVADRMVLSSAPVHADPESPGGLVVHTEESEVELAVFDDAAARWRRRRVHAPRAGVQLVLADDLAPPAAVPVPRAGGPEGRLAAPQDFSGAAVVELKVPAEHLIGDGRLLVRLDWTGDVGRARIGGRLVGEHYWHGRVWEIELTPWRDALRTAPLVLELLPWCAESGVWVHPSVRQVPDGVHLRRAWLVRRERHLVAPC